MKALVRIAVVLAGVLATACDAAAESRRIYALMPGNLLVRFQSDAPSSVTTIGVVTGIGPNETIRGIDFRPRGGKLYASTISTTSVAASTIRTYVVDSTTAAATLVGATAATLAGAGDLPTGYDFNPTVDLIRYVNTNDENARLSPLTGTLTSNDPDLAPAATTTIIAAAYDLATLWVIDRNDSQLAIQGGVGGSPSPNGGGVTDVGPLGFVLHAANDGGFDIASSAPRLAFAALTAAADNLTRLYSIDLTPTVGTAAPRATAIGPIGNGQTEVRSIAIVPERIQVVGADGKSTPQVRVFGAGGLRFGLDPYVPKFKGGVRVAVGDVTGDGVADVITGSGPKQVAHVRVFDGATGLALRSVLGSFLAFEPAFVGGVFVAAGDLNGDGADDIVVGADAGSTPQVRAFDGRTGAELASFLAYPTEFRGGVRVAAGDVNGDGLVDIITGSGPGGPAHVKVFAGPNNTQITSVFPFDAGFAGGVFVAAGDLDGDGRADIVTGAGAGGGPHVRVFNGADASVLYDFQATAERAKAGVRVAVSDVNRDGTPDIVVSFAPRGGTEVRAFDGKTLLQIQSFFAFERGPKGLFVGG